MDPQATLDAAEAAIEAGDRDDAREHLTNYSQWRARGGFEPDGGDARHKRLAARAFHMSRQES